MTQPYRAAIIGCGRVGVTMEADPRRIKPATHAGSFSLSKLASLDAIVDTMPQQLDQARKLFPKSATFTNAEEMLERVKPQIVSIATPPDEHRPVVELCARYKVPAIICEKPIALTPADAEAIIKACRDADSLLFINHTRRFDKLLAKTARRVKAGELGTISHGSAYYTAGLFNTGTHLIDMLHFLTGKEFEWARAISETRHSAPVGDINVNGWIGTTDGVLFSLQALEVKDYLIFEAQLFGSRGTLTVNRSGYELEWCHIIDSQDFEGYKEVDRFHCTREGASRTFFGDMVEHVIDCLEGRANVCSTGEDGLRTLRTLGALKLSAERNGQPVYVKEIK